MPDRHNEHINQLLDDIYRNESRRVFATLIRLLGDFDRAEDALHDAFRAAMEQWPEKGVPSNPRAWLVSAGRFKAIDKLRKESRMDLIPGEQTQTLIADTKDPSEQADDEIKDDELRLIFTCCHPALSQESRVALTLREVCGLTTEEIAHAFLTTPSTLAQRIVRAKSKIRDARIPYQVPTQDELPDRLEAVLQVIYLVFNEGYYASSGSSITRADLSNEAIRLGRLLLTLLPEPDVYGIVGLMLLHESRRTARTTRKGDLILLEDQDRSLWNRSLISEGLSLVEEAFKSGRIGQYTLQAAIAGVHADAEDAESTDWAQIVALYGLLMKVNPSPVVALNRAVAIAMRDGPKEGLELIDAMLDSGELSDYHLIHSARAELCRRLNRIEEARFAYVKALDLAQQEPERRFIRKRMKELKDQYKIS